jgi:hypothetical protein
MSEIRIPVPLLVVAVTGAAAAAIAAQLPEIRRYLKMESM